MQPVRPRSGLWADFDKLGPSFHPRARCRECGEETAEQPDQLKAHIAKRKVLNKVDTVVQRRGGNANSTNSSSASSSVGPPAKRQCQQLLCPSTTTEVNRAPLGRQFCRFVLATTVPFRVVDNQEFKALISMVRPGCHLSGERAVAGDLLESVYSECRSKIGGRLQ